MSKYGIRLIDPNAIYPFYLIERDNAEEWPGYAHLIQEQEGYHKIYKTDSIEEAEHHMNKILDFYRLWKTRLSPLEVHEFDENDIYDLLRGRR